MYFALLNDIQIEAELDVSPLIYVATFLSFDIKPSQKWDENLNM